MIGNAGFRIHPGSVSYPYLWWSARTSRSWNDGSGCAVQQSQETLINLVAIRD